MSVVQPLPHHLNLDDLQKQAETLLASWRASDPHRRSSLADAQLVVARGYGLASWAQLVQHLELSPKAQALHTMDRLFQATLTSDDQLNTVGQVLGRRADVLWRQHLDGHPAAAVFLDSAGAGETVDLDEVRLVVAHEHAFADWASVKADRLVDKQFEAAIDAIVSGDANSLRSLLDARPRLATTRSPFGHNATLLHYVAANGVENSRQWQTPRNAVEILRILLDHGADPDAPCNAYGGELTPLCALVSSVHPADAGVQGDLVEELCRGGANPNGRDNDGLPFHTAMTYGYVDAVDALARSGARIDSLAFAAAVGDLSLVTKYLSSEPVEYALIYAAGLGRRAVVELLLTHNPDLGVREPVFNSTAAGMARYYQRDDVLALLEGS